MKKTPKKEQNTLCGERVRLCRLSKGLTLEQLAEKVEALPSNNERARSSRHIGYVERGERTLSLEWACLLAEALDVRVEYLLCKDDFQTEWERELHPFAKKIAVKRFQKGIINAVLSEYGASFVSSAEYDFVPDMPTEDFCKLTTEEQERLMGDYFRIADEGVFYLLRGNDIIATIPEQEKERLEEDICDYIGLKMNKLMERYGKDETTREG